MIFKADEILNLGNAIKSTSTDLDELTKLTKGMTLEQSLAVLATKELTEEERNLILIENGLITVEKGKVIATNASTFSLSAYTAGIKANTKAWLANMVANPKTWIVAIGVAIYGIVKAIDYYNGALQRQKEKLEEVKQSFNEAQSNMESANQELKTAKNRIEELQSIDSLSFVESAELERLKETVEELSIAADIAEKIAQREKENLSKENEKTYNQEYGEYSSTNTSTDVKRIYNESQNMGEDGARYINAQLDDGNISATIASMLYAKKQLNDAEQNYIQAIEDNNFELADSFELVKKDAESQVRLIEDMLEDSIQTLSDYQQNAKLAGDTESEYYKSLEKDLKLLYEYTDPAGWNTIQVDKIFNTEGIEKTKEELVSMAKSGELTPETIAQYENLNKALSESNLILKEDEESAQKFVEQIYSMVEATGGLNADKMSIPSLEELHSNLDAIQDAYDTVASAIEEYNKQGYLSVDTYQSLMELEPQYLQYLMDEEGNLRLGTDAMNDYTSALIDNMAKKQMQQIVDYVGELDEEKRQLYLTKTATDEASESLLDFAASTISAKFATGELSNDELEGLKSMMANVASWAESAKAGLGKGGLGGGGSASKEFSETIDFFEERVENLNDAISLLDKNLENVSGSFAKNKLISAEIDLNAEKMNNYSDALAMYSQKASESLSSIPSDLRDKVVNGVVAINDFVGEGNEAVVDAIKEYQKWSDKIADCSQQLAELKETLRDLELEKFNNIISDFADQFDLRQTGIDNIDKQIALLEESGLMIGESFFVAQREQAEKQLMLLKEQQSAMANQLSSALASGNIQKGTDEWVEMVSELQNVEGQILDCEKSIEEFNNAILDINWQVFERIQDTFSNIDSELGNLVGLLDEIDVVDNSGNWTTDAITKLGLLSQQYELARHQVEQYNAEITKLNEDYANGKYSAIEYSERLAELSQKQWERVNSSEEILSSIVELNKQRVDIQIEGIEKEISAYESLIQSKIDALNAEKELNDYRDSISDKTKSITEIERQLAAMEGDNTASTIAKRKKLEQELADAKTDLERTQYDHSVEMQKEVLNEELKRFSEEKDAEIEKLEESLENQELLISQSLETVKQNSETIGNEITNIAKRHGITISNSIINSWKNGEKAIASYGQVLSIQSSAFIGELVRVEVETYNLQAQANVTASSLANMFGTRADNLVSQLTESYYSEANLYNMTNALQSSLRSTLEGGYDVSGITSALNSITDAANKAKYAVEDLSTTPKLPPNESITIQTGQGSTGTKNNKGNSLSSVTISKYASGTRSTNGNLFVKNEEGYELMLPKLTSGDYTIAPEGSQILTKAQTDNIFDWSKMNPVDLWNVPLASNLPKLPDSIKRNNKPISINSSITFTGDINDTNHFTKQITGIIDKQLDKSWKDFYNEIKY